MNGRRARVKASYNGKDITKSLKDYMSSASFTDNASGESDTLVIQIGDTEHKWTDSWMPSKGDSLEVRILVSSWESENDSAALNCGEFVIDQLSASGGSSSVTTMDIGAISGPVQSGFRETQRSKTWQKTTLQQVAKRIAARYGLSLHYDAGLIKIKSKEQSEAADSTFLQELCSTYGLVMKAYRKKLIIYDREKYKKKQHAREISLENDVDSWSFNDTLTRVYTGAQLTYTDPVSGKEIKKVVGTSKNLLKLSESADSAADAELKARAAVNNENHGKTQMSIQMIGDIGLVAGMVILLKDAGNKMGGKYFVDSVTHSVSSEGGYTCSLNMSKVREGI